MVLNEIQDVKCLAQNKNHITLYQQLKKKLTSQMEQMSLIVFKISGITKQRGTIPSDFKT